MHFLGGLFHRHLKHICSQLSAEVDYCLTTSLFQIQFSFFLSLLGFFSFTCFSLITLLPLGHDQYLDREHATSLRPSSPSVHNVGKAEVCPAELCTHTVLLLSLWIRPQILLLCWQGQSSIRVMVRFSLLCIFFLLTVNCGHSGLQRKRCTGVW